MTENHSILAEIESLRKELEELSKDKPLHDPEVVELSSKLDRKIVEFLMKIKS